MLGPVTWLTGLKRLNVLKADDIVIVLLFIILKMPEANFNVNLSIRESDDDIRVLQKRNCLPLRMRLCLKQQEGARSMA